MMIGIFFLYSFIPHIECRWAYKIWNVKIISIKKILFYSLKPVFSMKFMNNIHNIFILSFQYFSNIFTNLMNRKNNTI